MSAAVCDAPAQVGDPMRDFSIPYGQSPVRSFIARGAPLLGKRWNQVALGGEDCRLFDEGGFGSFGARVTIRDCRFADYRLEIRLGDRPAGGTPERHFLSPAEFVDPLRLRADVIRLAPIGPAAPSPWTQSPTISAKWRPLAVSQRSKASRPAQADAGRARRRARQCRPIERFPCADETIDAAEQFRPERRARAAPQAIRLMRGDREVWQLADC